MWSSSSLAFFTRRRTRPRLELRVEDHHQDDAVADELDVDVRLLALVELVGELVLPSSFAMPPVAAMLPAVSEASEVVSMLLDVAARGDQLAVLVDDEDDLGVRVPDEAVARPLWIWLNSSSYITIWGVAIETCLSRSPEGDRIDRLSE